MEMEQKYLQSAVKDAKNFLPCSMDDLLSQLKSSTSLSEQRNILNEISRSVDNNGCEEQHLKVLKELNFTDKSLSGRQTKIIQQVNTFKSSLMSDLVDSLESHKPSIKGLIRLLERINTLYCDADFSGECIDIIKNILKRYDHEELTAKALALLLRISSNNRDLGLLDTRLLNSVCDHLNNQSKRFACKHVLLQQNNLPEEVIRKLINNIASNDAKKAEISSEIIKNAVQKNSYSNQVLFELLKQLPLAENKSCKNILLTIGDIYKNSPSNSLTDSNLISNLEEQLSKFPEESLYALRYRRDFMTDSGVQQLISIFTYTHINSTAAAQEYAGEIIAHALRDQSDTAAAKRQILNEWLNNHGCDLDKNQHDILKRHGVLNDLSADHFARNFTNIEDNVAAHLAEINDIIDRDLELVPKTLIKKLLAEELTIETTSLLIKIIRQGRSELPADFMTDLVLRIKESANNELPLLIFNTALNKDGQLAETISQEDRDFVNMQQQLEDKKNLANQSNTLNNDLKPDTQDPSAIINHFFQDPTKFASLPEEYRSRIAKAIYYISPGDAAQVDERLFNHIRTVLSDCPADQLSHRILSIHLFYRITTEKTEEQCLQFDHTVEDIFSSTLDPEYIDNFLIMAHQVNDIHVVNMVLKDLISSTHAIEPKNQQQIINVFFQDEGKYGALNENHRFSISKAIAFISPIDVEFYSYLLRDALKDCPDAQLSHTLLYENLLHSIKSEITAEQQQQFADNIEAILYSGLDPKDIDIKLIIAHQFKDIDIINKELQALILSLDPIEAIQQHLGENISEPTINKLVDLGYSADDVQQIKEKYPDAHESIINSIADYGINPENTNYRDQNVFDILKEGQGADAREIVDKVSKLGIATGFAANSAEKSLDIILAEIKEKNSSINITRLKQDYTTIIEKFGQDSVLFGTGKAIKDWQESDIKNWKQGFVAKPFNASEDLFEAIAVIKQANILCSKGKEDPRISQILSLLLMVNRYSDAPDATLQKAQGSLAQINTGEGKTTIVAMLAVINALKGEKVDIITSSPVLATRDAAKKAAFFNLFDFTVSDNAGKDAEAYVKDILYGSVNNFQFDFLRDEHKQLNIRRNRPFGVVIADEVDSMLIDEGSKIAMLSEGIAGMEYLEALLTVVYLTVNQFSMGYQRDEATGKVFLKNPDDPQSPGIEISNPIEFTKEKVKEKIHQLFFSEEIKEESKIQVPGNLKEFAKSQTDDWITNALVACTLVNGKDYIVKDDEVIPVDFNNTGVIQNSTQWQNGLHQFVQIQHQVSLTPESFTTSFISNVGYFKKYANKLFGLTGTLGTNASKHLLETTYNVNCVTIPTYKQKKFIELTPTIAPDRSLWMETIKSSTVSETKKGRAVLIICESINDVKAIHDQLGVAGIPNDKMVCYFDDSADAKINEVDSGQVIIATNLAGRGTDIETSKNVEYYGGLHVCLTFLPSNLRVEEQAFGRTSRQGKNGTGQLVLDLESTNGLTDITQIKAMRDSKEEQRLAQIESHELQVITTKDELFLNRFIPYIKRLRSQEHTKDKNLIKGVEERWGLFFAQLEKEDFKPGFTKEAIFAKYDAFQAEIESNIPQDNVIRSFAYYTRQGNELCSRNQDQAIQKYHKAIALDPVFAYGAHYNKAYALLVNKEHKDKNYITEAKASLEAAKESIEKTLIPQLQAMMGILNPLTKIEASLSESQREIDQKLKSQPVPQQKDKNNADDDLPKTEFSKQCSDKFCLLQTHLTYIKNALDIINKREQDHDILIDSEMSLEDLFEEKNRPTREIQELHNNGIFKFFTVKVKPPTDWNGIICVFVIGALQLIAGAALTVLGVANLGLALISEGVGDIITGIKSSITGEFNWIEHLKDKAISIAISVVTAGVSAIKTAFKAVSDAAKTGIKAVTEMSKTAMKEIGKNIAKKIGFELIAEGAKEILKLGTNFISEAFLNLFTIDIKAKVKETLGDLATKINAINSDQSKIAKVRKAAQDIFNNKSSELLQLAEKFMRGVLSRLKGKDAELIQKTLKIIDVTEAIKEASTYAASFRDKMSIEIEKQRSDLTSPMPESKTVQPADSTLIDEWTTQITQKILAIINGQINSVVNPAVGKAVNKFSTAMQRSFSSSNKTIDEKIYDHQAKLIHYQAAIKTVKNPAEVEAFAADPNLPHSTEDRPANINDLTTMAVAAKTPAIIYTDGEKPRHVGPKNGKKPVELDYHPPSEEHPEGHFVPRNAAESNDLGGKSCGFDAFAAELKHQGINADPQRLKDIAHANYNNKKDLYKAGKQLDSLPPSKRGIMNGGKPGTIHSIDNLKDPGFLKKYTIDNANFYNEADQAIIAPTNQLINTKNNPAIKPNPEYELHLYFKERNDNVVVPVVKRLDENNRIEANTYYLPYMNAVTGANDSKIKTPFERPKHPFVITGNMHGCSFLAQKNNDGIISFMHDNMPVKNAFKYRDLYGISRVDSESNRVALQNMGVSSTGTYSRGGGNLGGPIGAVAGFVAFHFEKNNAPDYYDPGYQGKFIIQHQVVPTNASYLREIDKVAGDQGVTILSAGPNFFKPPSVYNNSAGGDLGIRPYHFSRDV